MRRILVHLDVEILKHDSAFDLTDEVLEKEVGNMVGATVPRMLGIGAMKITIPDGRGNFVPKPCVLVRVVHVGIEAVPENPPELQDQPPAERALKIVTP